jgi:hypothetical protein
VACELQVACPGAEFTEPTVRWGCSLQLSRGASHLVNEFSSVRVGGSCRSFGGVACTVPQRVIEMLIVRVVSIFSPVFLALRVYTCYRLLLSTLRCNPFI